MRRGRRHGRRVIPSGPRIRFDEQTARQIFGGNVVRHRERLGWTQAECAERAAVTLSELAAIESGSGESGASGVARVAEVFGCDTDDLMGDLRWISSPGEDGRGHYEFDD
jgi:transcriptional regulator with XRE-family HTH domain